MINRLQMALTILFSRRVLILKRRYDRRRHKDCVTLYGTLHDRAEQVDLLRRMSDSIFGELTPEEQEKLRTLQERARSLCPLRPASTTKSSE